MENCLLRVVEKSLRSAPWSITIILTQHSLFLSHAGDWWCGTRFETLRARTNSKKIKKYINKILHRDW
jgi:hypothetical protein